MHSNAKDAVWDVKSSTHHPNHHANANTRPAKKTQVGLFTKQKYIYILYVPVLRVSAHPPFPNGMVHKYYYYYYYHYVVPVLLVLLLLFVLLLVLLLLLLPILLLCTSSTTIIITTSTSTTTTTTPTWSTWIQVKIPWWHLKRKYFSRRVCLLSVIFEVTTYKAPFTKSVPQMSCYYVDQIRW